MKAIDLIRWALTFTEHGVAGIVKGMESQAACMTRPTKGGKGGDGNHALWNLGHITVTEGSLRHIVAGEPNPVEHWWPIFGTGTQPSDDAAAYPSFAEVLAKFHEFRAYNIKLLDRLGEAALDQRPPNVPPGFEQMMTSIGNTFLLLTLHHFVHYGQIADARRVVGLKPLM